MLCVEQKKRGIGHISLSKESPWKKRNKKKDKQKYSNDICIYQHCQKMIKTFNNHSYSCIDGFSLIRCILHARGYIFLFPSCSILSRLVSSCRFLLQDSLSHSVSQSVIIIFFVITKTHNFSFSFFFTK